MEKNDKLKNNTQVDYETKVLEVKDLEKHFHIGTGRNRMVNKAVDNISFDIYKKEVFGIVGESGSGKTTAGRTIMKLYNPTNGTTKLNGVTIGAGYRGNYSRIRRYYREERQAIRDLDVYQNQLYILEQNAKKAIKNLEQKIVDLELSTQEKIRSNNGPIDKYKVERYTLKNNLTIDISNEEFKFEQAKLELLSKTKNIYQTKLDNEIAIEHKIYDSKKDALKESAALEKTVIAKELQELDKVHNQILKDLKDKFTPLIESYHDSVLDKKIAKVEINKLLVDKKAVLSKLRNDYKDSLLQISKPDTEGIKVSNKLINENLKNEIKSLRSEIKQIRQQLVLDKKNLKRPELTDELEKELKDAIDAIKLDTKNKVQEEKEKIKELRTINNSKDSLIYSRKMQMIFQDPISSLNPRMTVKEIISEGLIILGGYSDEEITQKVNDMLITVGLSPEYAARYPHEFSGGQRQRIGIARALIMNPDFVIADEPISALDVSIRAQVINLLTNLKDELGLTILFIAHDLSVVRFFCDRIGVMFNGKIVELAPSEELFNNPMHEYTKSLLSAIPQPDPDYEKGRKRINYNPLEVHDYSVDKPSMREIAPGHQVYANEAEFKQMKAVYDKNNKVKGGTSK